MKKITVLLIAILIGLPTISAQNESNGDSAQVNNTSSQIEYTDTPADREIVKGKDYGDAFKTAFSFDSGMFIATLSIICAFGLPVIVVFLSFYFGYKKRKAKYRLVEKALETGQPLPEEFLRQSKNSGSPLSKGITNTFTGIGLFIFLWAITSEFSIGCVGLLVMFMGLGQIVIHYAQEKKYEKTENPNRKDDHTSNTAG